MHEQLLSNLVFFNATVFPPNMSKRENYKSCIAAEAQCFISIIRYSVHPGLRHRARLPGIKPLF